MKYPGGRCRRARKIHRCDNVEPGWARPCGRVIGISEIYFDPRIAKDLRSGHYETLRICARCAGLPYSMPQFDLFVLAPVESVSESQKRRTRKGKRFPI